MKMWCFFSSKTCLNQCLHSVHLCLIPTKEHLHEHPPLLTVPHSSPSFFSHGKPKVPEHKRPVYGWVLLSPLPPCSCTFPTCGALLCEASVLHIQVSGLLHPLPGNPWAAWAAAELLVVKSRLFPLIHPRRNGETDQTSRKLFLWLTLSLRRLCKVLVTCHEEACSVRSETKQ